MKRKHILLLVGCIGVLVLIGLCIYSGSSNEGWWHGRRWGRGWGSLVERERGWGGGPPVYVVENSNPHCYADCIHRNCPFNAAVTHPACLQECRESCS